MLATRTASHGGNPDAQVFLYYIMHVKYISTGERLFGLSDI
jgi:hypothetical protein